MNDAQASTAAATEILGIKTPVEDRLEIRMRVCKVISRTMSRKAEGKRIV